MNTIASKPLTMERAKELLSASSTKRQVSADAFMILDGERLEKVAFHAPSVGCFKGRAGESRRLYPADKGVVAYKAPSYV